MKKNDMEGCTCDCCDHRFAHHHGGGKHWLFTIGVVAFVYGLMSWAIVAYGWQPYTGWMVGGLLLIVIGWLKMWKKHMMMMKME